MTDQIDHFTCVANGTHEIVPDKGAKWHRQEHPDGTPIGDTEYMEGHCEACGDVSLIGRPVEP